MIPLRSLVAAFLLIVFAAPLSAEDWTVLFDGKDLSQWEAVKAPLSTWKIEDGILYCTASDGWLSTKDEYDNFELELEFKLYEAANSGVFLRAPRAGDPAWDGLEVQILDDSAPKYRKLESYQKCGGLYGCVGPSIDVKKKPGEWQSYRIVVDGRKVQVMLNGTQIIDANLDDFLSDVEKHPGLKRERGYVGLQAHGGRVDFRNVRVRQLAAK